MNTRKAIARMQAGRRAQGVSPAMRTMMGEVYRARVLPERGIMAHRDHATLNALFVRGLVTAKKAGGEVYHWAHTAEGKKFVLEDQ